ncbi:hypothetical protein GCM10029963_78630 [Micromonospora andamanensis]
MAWLAGPLGLSWQTVALLALAIAATAAGWRARSRAVRMWRAAIAVVLGTVAVATVAAGGPAAMAAHPVATIFLPTLFGVLLGWPWWYHLRTRPPQDEPAPVATGMPTTVVDPLTDQWSRRWRTEVIGEGVCAGTTLVKATEPRPGVTEALIRLAPKTKPGPLFKSGPDVEVALDLDEGAVGWRSTGKTAWLRVIIVERSYIGDGVPWHGPTYEGGRCEIARFTDGSPGPWVFSRPNFGVLGGLVVGSSGSGKTRALGALNANLLEGGFQVVVGDPQNGQSLPAWKDAVEYHAGIEATILLLRRFHAEVMRRSALLADAGVDTYDENDPRVKALGLGKLMVIVDECQLVLIPNTPLVPLVEQTAETMRKTGAGLVLATQLPQMRSLGGSVRLRDALVAGNALVLRLSNRGSGTTILPDDFVGDPFAIEREIDGKSTAGMGYLRHSNRVGMICRVPHLDEAAAAAASPRVPVRWNVPAIDPSTPIKAPRTSTATAQRPAEAPGTSCAPRSASAAEPPPWWSRPCRRPAPSGSWPACGADPRRRRLCWTARTARSTRPSSTRCWPGSRTPAASSPPPSAAAPGPSRPDRRRDGRPFSRSGLRGGRQAHPDLPCTNARTRRPTHGQHLRRRPRRKTEAEVDRGAELARRAGEATQAAWTGTARGAGRLARRLPSAHRTSGVDQPGHDIAGLVLLLTGLLVAAAEWTNPAGLPGRILDLPAAVTGGLLGGLAPLTPLPLLWLAVEAMRHPAGRHTVRILAQAAGIVLIATGVGGLLDLADPGLGGLLGRITGALDGPLSVWGAVPLLVGLIAAGLTAATRITPVALVTSLATARRRKTTIDDLDDLDLDDLDVDVDDRQEPIDAPPAAAPAPAHPSAVDSVESARPVPDAHGGPGARAHADDAGDGRWLPAAAAGSARRR